MPRFVTVHRSFDPIAAEIARDLLVDAGLTARLSGASTGAVGLGPALVEVPEAAREDAERILAAHADDLAAPDAEPDVADEPVASQAEVPHPLRALLAAGVTPVCPGGGHLYARRRVLGVLILIAQLTALVTCIVGGPRGATAAAVFAIGLFLFDLVGAQLAVRAENRGRRPSATRQAATGAVLVALLGGVTVLATPYLVRIHFLRHGASDPDDAERMRSRSTAPADLPFPLHLDFTR